MSVETSVIRQSASRTPQKKKHTGSQWSHLARLGLRRQQCQTQRNSKKSADRRRNESCSGSRVRTPLSTSATLRIELVSAAGSLFAAPSVGAVILQKM